ncbi:H-NS histone family protein [Endozoicomonas ascidiicola]|uniref:H-NS histone family protein n=1 Tax=Endozoicomonas ascidiicola TaxID=1698521 RepID=UPI0008317127|nr:H-NS histone family protein [Endozoicomonas ascidiicola]
MNIFEESMNLLKSKVKIRQLTSDLHAEDLQRIVDRVEAIYIEKLEEEKARQEELEAKEAALSEIKGKLKELGLSVSDLDGISPSEKPKQKRKYKEREKFTFMYETPEGEQRSWHGATVGRKPADFTEYLGRTGKNIKDCIVS